MRAGELADLDAVELIDLETTDWTATVNCVAVALEARRLVELQERWLNSPGWVERVHKPVPGYPKRPVPDDEDAAKALKKRTPTNSTIPAGQRLADAHATLDAAVAAAYSASADIAHNDALRELLALNVADSKGAATWLGSRGEAC